MREWLICMLAACGGGGGGGGVANVEVTPATAMLSPLDTVALAATVLDDAGRPVAGAAVAWATSDGATASVDNGRVNAVAPGTATITATSGGVAGQAAITVRDAPAVRWGHALAYDAARERVVLFGGSAGTAFLGDTWTWDGAGWQRQSVTGPAPRDQHVMAYDAARQRVVLFGGRLADDTRATDTWEWDGTAWTQRASSGPPAREHHAGGYDAARARFVVHGGQSGSTTLADTWAWDGASWTSVSTTVPAPRQLPSRGMVFSSLHGTLLMGIGDLTAGGSELWEWNGTSWSVVPGGQLDADSPLPLVETGAPGQAIALDEAPASTGAAYTWAWSGTGWTRIATTGPPPRAISAVAFDAARGQVVLFGGSAPRGGKYFGDTWLWSGTGWLER